MVFSDDAAAPAPVARRPGLPIVPTITLAFRVFARAPWHFIGLLILSALLGLVPSLLAALSKAESWYPAARAGALVLEYAIQFTVTGAVIQGAAMVCEGAPFDFESALGIGLRRSIPILVVTVVQIVAIFAGGLLFVIPGIFAALVFAVAVPATVIDAFGPMRSLGRSMDLTRGNRWRLLGLGALVVILPMACLGALIFAFAKAHIILAAVIPLAVVYLLALVVLGATLPSVLYLQLRAIEELGEPLSLPA